MTESEIKQLQDEITQTQGFVWTMSLEEFRQLQNKLDELRAIHDDLRVQHLYSLSDETLEQYLSWLSLGKI